MLLEELVQEGKCGTNGIAVAVASTGRITNANTEYQSLKPDCSHARSVTDGHQRGPEELQPYRQHDLLTEQ